MISATKFPFKLEGTVPSDYEQYATYYYAFHDVAEHGLTFDETSVEVFVDGTKITWLYRNHTCDRWLHI